MSLNDCDKARLRNVFTVGYSIQSLDLPTHCPAATATLPGVLSQSVPSYHALVVSGVHQRERPAVLPVTNQGHQ